MINKIKEKAFVLFMAIAPIFYLTNSGDLRDAQAKFYQLGAIALISCFIENIWLTMFMLLNLFLLLSTGVETGINQVLNVFIGCLLFTVSKNYFKNKSFMDFSKVILWICFFNISWMMLQVLNIDPLYVGQMANGTPLIGQVFNDPLGLFGIKMANGIFLSIASMVMAVLNQYIGMLIIIPILMSHASTAVLAWIVSMLFFTWHIKRRLFIILSIIGVLGIGTYIVLDQKDDPNTFKSRFGMWHMVTRYSIINPIGFGPDSFRNLNEKKKFMFVSDNHYNPAIMVFNQANSEADVQYYDPKRGITNEPWKGNQNEINVWDNAHNEYLQLFFEYGIIGVLLLIGLFRDMIIRFNRCDKTNELIMLTSILLVYFVSSISHFPLHLARLGCLFPIFLGVWYARTEN